LKVFSQKFVGMAGFTAISPNGSVICADFRSSQKPSFR